PLPPPTPIYSAVITSQRMVAVAAGAVWRGSYCVWRRFMRKRNTTRRNTIETGGLELGPPLELLAVDALPSLGRALAVLEWGGEAFLKLCRRFKKVPARPSRSRRAAPPARRRPSRRACPPDPSHRADLRPLACLAWPGYQKG